ncbi:MAG TPA: methyltransferase domain-containing protein [Polyangia bacterium]|jgi:SAM-dependent methyltransferase
MNSSYGDRVADRYDEQYGSLGSADATVALLAELAAPGNRALELGIGTGRVALPLAARGIAVTGIDCSEKMLARLAAKPGGDKVRTVLGDMGEVAADGEYDLVYVVFNTFFALLTQDAQIGCLERAAARLAPGGKLLVEVFVPDLTRFEHNVRWFPRRLDGDGVLAEASWHDPIAQRVDSNHIYLEQDQSVHIVPIKLRYANVPELDLMARVAGLALHARWAGWNKEPFGNGSQKHVSVYARAAR